MRKLLDFVGDVALALMAVAAIGIAEMFVVVTALELAK